VSNRRRSLVIEDAFKAFCGYESPPPAYFYCSRSPSEPGRSNPENIIASIARQLSCLKSGDLLPPAIAAYEKMEKDAFAAESMRLDESRALIIQLIEEYYPTVVIIIDALDECDPDTRSDLLEFLESILQESSSLVKTFVSSRDDQDIVCQLQNYPSLELSSDRNSDDIAEFVKSETRRLIKKKALLRSIINKKELQNVIIDRITEGAKGM